MPVFLMVGLGARISMREKRVVVLEIEMVRLYPYAGNIHGVDVRGKSAVCVVDVVADVLTAGDNLIRKMWDFLVVGLCQTRLEDLIKILRIGVQAIFPVLMIEHRVHGGRHILVIRRAEPL